MEHLIITEINSASCYCACVLRISRWLEKLGFPMGGAYDSDGVFERIITLLEKQILAMIIGVQNWGSHAFLEIIEVLIWEKTLYIVLY